MLARYRAAMSRLGPAEPIGHGAALGLPLLLLVVASGWLGRSPTPAPTPAPRVGTPIATTVATTPRAEAPGEVKPAAAPSASPAPAIAPTPAPAVPAPTVVDPLTGFLAPGAYAPALGLEPGDGLRVSVDPTTGLCTLWEEDLVVGDVALRRARTSGDERPGAFGRGWRVEHEARLFVVEDGVVVHRIDGVSFFEPVEAEGLDRAVYVSAWGDVEYLAPVDGGWELQDVLGRTLAFDAAGRLARLTPGYAVERGPGRTSLVGAHSRVDLAHDADGRVVRASIADGVALTFAHDAAGELVRVRGARAREYTAQSGHVTAVRRGALDLLLLTHDASGQLATLETPDERQTYTFDGATVFMTARAGRWTYHLAPDAWTIETPGGVERAWLDGRGAVVATQAPGGARVERAQDALGRAALTAFLEAARSGSEPRSSARLPSGAAVRVERDAAGRVSALEARAGALRVREQLTWDDAGRLATRTGPDGRTSRYERDEQGRVVAESRPAGRTAFTWQGRDLTSVVTPAGRTWSLCWDAARGLVSVDAPGGRSSYENDGAGRVLRAQDESGKDVRVARDGAGRPTRVSAAGGPTWSFTWDAAGRMTSAAADGATLRTAYDEHGRPTFLESLRDGGSQRLATYGYDGARTSIETPWGTTTEVEDDLARVVAMRTPAGEFRFERDARGLLTAVRYPNGVVARTAYDGLGRVVEHTAARPGQTPALALSHGWSPRHERSWTRRDGVERRFTFDAAGRLSEVAGGGTTATFAWNGDGDRVASNGSRWSYDTRGRLASIEDAGSSTDVTEVRFAHDDAGRLLTRMHAGGVDQFDYDAVGRLARVRRAGAPEVRYGYDPLGRVDRRVEAGRTVRFVWDGDRLLAELGADGRALRTWVYGPGLDEPLAYREGDAWTFVHADDLGTVLAYTDETGRPVARAAWSPWGELESAPGARPAFFAGRLLDPVAGVVIMRARAYDPSHGRFLTADPSLLEGGHNAYAYADGNPLDYVDPLGLWSVPGWMKSAGSWVAEKAVALKDGAVGVAEGIGYLTGLAGTPEMQAAARQSVVEDFVEGKAQSRVLGTVDGYANFLTFGLVDPNTRQWAYDEENAEIGRGYGTAGGVAFSAISGAGLLKAGGQALVNGARALPGALRAAPGALRALPGALRAAPGALRDVAGRAIAATPALLRRGVEVARSAPAWLRQNAVPLAQAAGNALRSGGAQVWNVTGRPFVNVARDTYNGARNVVAAARDRLRPMLQGAREARAANAAERGVQVAEAANGAARVAPRPGSSGGGAAAPQSPNTGLVEVLGDKGGGAIRPAVASAAGRAPSSTESLGGLLDDVWARRGELQGQGARPIYNAYNATAEANPLARSATSYLDDLTSIAERRPPGATSNTQSFGGRGNALGDVKEARALGGNMAKKVDNTFYRFERPGSELRGITDRVYVNANADTAPALMRRLVDQIVDDPARFPGVEMAKISGPGAVGGRAENIVLYTTGPEASQRVVDALAAIQRESPGLFRSTIPRMTQPATSGGQTLAGVAQGAEPVVANASFGSVRADAIARALDRTTRAGGDRAMFDRLVAEEFVARGVDPRAPHLNLGPAQ